MTRRVKRIAIMIAGFILLGGGCAAGYVRTETQVNESMQVSEELCGNSFDDFRDERKESRQIQISQLNEMIHSGVDDPEILALAQRRLLDLLDRMEKETNLEGMLKMRSFEDVIVAVSTDTANVFVKGDVLTQQQTAVILELVSREMKISGRNVKIIPIN